MKRPIFMNCYKDVDSKHKKEGKMISRNLEEALENTNYPARIVVYSDKNLRNIIAEDANLNENEAINITEWIDKWIEGFWGEIPKNYWLEITVYDVRKTGNNEYFIFDKNSIGEVEEIYKKIIKGEKINAKKRGSKWKFDELHKLDKHIAIKLSDEDNNYFCHNYFPTNEVEKLEPIDNDMIIYLKREEIKFNVLCKNIKSIIRLEHFKLGKTMFIECSNSFLYRIYFKEKEITFDNEIELEKVIDILKNKKKRKNKLNG